MPCSGCSVLHGVNPNQKKKKKKKKKKERKKEKEKNCILLIVKIIHYNKATFSSKQHFFHIWHYIVSLS